MSRGTAGDCSAGTLFPERYTSNVLFLIEEFVRFVGFICVLKYSVICDCCFLLLLLAVVAQ